MGILASYREFKQNIYESMTERQKNISIFLMSLILGMMIIFIIPIWTEAGTKIDNVTIDVGKDDGNNATGVVTYTCQKCKKQMGLDSKTGNYVCSTDKDVVVTKAQNETILKENKVTTTSTTDAEIQDATTTADSSSTNSFIAWVLENITQWCLETAIGIINIILTLFGNTLTLNYSTFINALGGNNWWNNLSNNVIMPLSYAILTVLIVWGLFKGMFSKDMDADVEEPYPLLMRGFIGFACISFCRTFINTIVGWIDALFDATDAVSYLNGWSDITSKKLKDGITIDSLQAIDGATTVVSNLVRLVFIIIFIWVLVEVMLSYVYRYCACQLYRLAFPLGLSAMGSKKTFDSTTKSYAQLYLTSILGFMFSAMLIRLYVQGMVKCLTSKTTDITTLAISCFIVYEFGKLIQQLEDILSKAGLIAVKPSPSRLMMMVGLGGSRAVGGAAHAASHAAGKAIGGAVNAVSKGLTGQTLGQAVSNGISNALGNGEKFMTEAQKNLKNEGILKAAAKAGGHMLTDGEKAAAHDIANGNGVSFKGKAFEKGSTLYTGLGDKDAKTLNGVGAKIAQSIGNDKKGIDAKVTGKDGSTSMMHFTPNGKGGLERKTTTGLDNLGAQSIKNPVDGKEYKGDEAGLKDFKDSLGNSLDNGQTLDTSYTDANGNNHDITLGKDADGNITATESQSFAEALQSVGAESAQVGQLSDVTSGRMDSFDMDVVNGTGGLEQTNGLKGYSDFMADHITDDGTICGVGANIQTGQLESISVSVASKQDALDDKGNLKDGYTTVGSSGYYARITTGKNGCDGMRDLHTVNSAGKIEYLSPKTELDNNGHAN